MSRAILDAIEQLGEALADAGAQWASVSINVSKDADVDRVFLDLGTPVDPTVKHVDPEHVVYDGHVWRAAKTEIRGVRVSVTSPHRAIPKEAA